MQTICSSYCIIIFYYSHKIISRIDYNDLFYICATTTTILFSNNNNNVRRKMFSLVGVSIYNYLRLKLDRDFIQLSINYF